LADAARCLACRDHALVAWVVLWDLPAYPERYAARLATSTASPYLLLAETLAGVPAERSFREGSEPVSYRSRDSNPIFRLWFYINH
jgi:hypothetical protein